MLWQCKCERVTSPQLCHTDPRDAALGPHFNLPFPEAEPVLTTRQEELQSYSSTQVRDILRNILENQKCFQNRFGKRSQWPDYRGELANRRKDRIRSSPDTTAFLRYWS